MSPFATALINRWVHEHEVAQEKLAQLDQAIAVQDWKAVQIVAQWLFDELKLHNEAEERWLFPRMQEKLGQGPGPIAAMCMEHRHIWGHEEALMTSLAHLPPMNSAETIRHAQEIVEVLSAHIFKENNVLYPMAERILSRQELEALDREFQANI
jgi:regulator of cell morphogenesis and NO signaling